jgi:hypothetical protein
MERLHELRIGSGTSKKELLMARTAILAWGSLISELRDLATQVRGSWEFAGPEVFVEFSRVSQSRDNALTLVIDSQHGSKVRTHFIESSRVDPNDSACDLRVREGTGIGNIGLVDLRSDIVRSHDEEVARTIREWAAEQGFDAVVWTDLQSNFQEKTGKPFSVPAAIEYLTNLPPQSLRIAMQYIANAPKTVRTRLRDALDYNAWWKSAQRELRPEVDLKLPTPTPRDVSYPSGLRMSVRPPRD